MEGTDVENISLDDMEYRNDEGNESYEGYLENGDILWMAKYGYYGDDRPWDWKVYLPEKYPFQCYQASRRCYDLQTAEDCLDNFYEFYKPREWLSRSEYKEKYGPTYYRCLECDWEGDSDEIESVTVYEDYGDVSCPKCPGCGRVQYDGMDLLEEIE